MSSSATKKLHNFQKNECEYQQTYKATKHSKFYKTEHNTETIKDNLDKTS